MCGKAADAQLAFAKPSVPSGKQREPVKREWHHDLAIIGTAAHLTASVVVTGEVNGWNRYKPFLKTECDCDIEVIESFPLMGNEAVRDALLDTAGEAAAGDAEPTDGEERE